MPENSFTHISEAWHSTSWLDHCLCTVDAHDYIDSIKINYDMATSDHIPFSIMLNQGNLPLLMSDDDSIRTGKIDWPKLSKDDYEKYVCRSDVLLSNSILPK